MAPQKQPKVEVVADARMPTGTAALVGGAKTVVITNLGEGPVIDFVCGLRKVGPSLYSVVVGQVVDGVPTLKVDGVAQSLDHASFELESALRRLMETIP